MEVRPFVVHDPPSAGFSLVGQSVDNLRSPPLRGLFAFTAAEKRIFNMSARNEVAIREKTEARIIRRKQVEARIGLSRSTIYEGVNAGTFPKPIRLGAQSVGWIESEIEQWICDRIEASRSASQGAAT